jgi:transposase
MDSARIPFGVGLYPRQLPVECANHVIGPRGKDSALRRWGLSLGARGGSYARRGAIVAVARKLAVLVHRIWITQEAYVPFYAVAA